MASRAPPDYYAILEIGEDATTAQIRSAYKRAALKTHPDRVANDAPERASRTRKFQLVNDAFYTLSDPQRRRDYDNQRSQFRRSTRSKPANTSEDAAAENGQDENVPPAEGAQTRREYHYSWTWDFLSNRNRAASPEAERQRAEDEQFQDVFEEMMREEGMAEDGPGGQPTGKFWSMLGAVSGGALGFIVANVPGLVAGAVAGNRLGSVRDTKGKSVYAVYQELPQNDRAKLLGQLAVRVFSHIAGVE